MFLSCNLRVKNKLNMDYSNLSKTGCQMGFFLLLLICLHWLVMGIFGRASDPTETRSPPPLLFGCSIFHFDMSEEKSNKGCNVLPKQF